ncbi:MAG: glutathione S-transferase family protein, partial [Stellaceae bacterium]
MTNDQEHASAKPRLYHAPSSYYSMIARLALAEGGIGYEPVFVEIHYRGSQQRPDYVRLNPNMTVPTLVLPDRALAESRDIAEFALGVADAGLDDETRRWLDLHYAFPIDQLTFGGLLSRNPLARMVIPKRLAAAERRLLRLAAANPDLADLYKARAALFAERVRMFEPAKVQRLAVQRRGEAIGLLDQMEANFADGRAVMVPPSYGVADTVWTVFLGRMEFAGLGAELQKRPGVARYWRAMEARPSFAAADIWTKMHLGRP